MVNEEEDLWCRYCKAFHVEETCPEFIGWIKEGIYEDPNEMNNLSFVDEDGLIYTLGGKADVISKEDMGEIKEKSTGGDKVQELSG